MDRFELVMVSEDKRGKKCFVSTFSGMQIGDSIQLEKYVAIKKGFGYFNIEVFNSNFDFTKLEGKFKNFYLGDNEDSSYYLLSFIPANSKPEIKRMGSVIFVNEKSYLPLSLAYDLCPDQRSRKLIEAISKIRI